MSYRQPEKGEPLSAREREILGHMADGLEDQDIGRKLFMARDTVKTYNRRMFVKLGVHSRAAAVSAGYRLGLLDTGRNCCSHCLSVRKILTARRGNRASAAQLTAYAMFYDRVDEAVGDGAT